MCHLIFQHKLWVEQPENFPTCLATKPCPKEVNFLSHIHLILFVTRKCRNTSRSSSCTRGRISRKIMRLSLSDAFTCDAVIHCSIKLRDRRQSSPLSTFFFRFLSALQDGRGGGPGLWLGRLPPLPPQLDPGRHASGEGESDRNDQKAGRQVD